jgi:hypothetical protein
VSTRTELFALGGAFLCFALPRGVKLTALGLEEGIDSFRLWCGLPLLALGLVGLECLRVAARQFLAESPSLAQRLRGTTTALQVAAVFFLQAVVILQFLLLLDGHVHFWACCWLYLVYATGAVALVLVRNASTEWGKRYLRSAWAPIIAFGMPLLLPTLRTYELVAFGPLRW